MKLVTKTARPGDWIAVVPDETPGPEPHTITVGGVVQAAFVSDGKLMVKCPNLTPGVHAVEADGGPRWAITITE